MHHEKVKELVWQKWDLKLGNKNYWLDWDKAEKLGSPSYIVFLSVETACLPCLRIISVSLFEETVMTSFVIQGEANLLKTHPKLWPLCSRLQSDLTVFPERNYTFWPKRKQLIFQENWKIYIGLNLGNIICPPYLQDFHPCFLPSADWKYLKKYSRKFQTKLECATC